MPSGRMLVGSLQSVCALSRLVLANLALLHILFSCLLMQRLGVGGEKKRTCPAAQRVRREHEHVFPVWTIWLHFNIKKHHMRICILITSWKMSRSHKSTYTPSICVSPLPPQP